MLSLRPDRDAERFFLFSNQSPEHILSLTARGFVLPPRLVAAIDESIAPPRKLILARNLIAPLDPRRHPPLLGLARECIPVASVTSSANEANGSEPEERLAGPGACHWLVASGPD